jgi:hypothetical protein
MGITFKAFDTNLRFPVALKIINSAYLEKRDRATTISAGSSRRSGTASPERCVCI